MARLHTLNPVGTCIWEAIADGATTNAVAKAVAERFRVTEDAARADAQIFLEELTARGLVDRTTP